ncbi:MAG: ABC transporter permease subunit [Tetrasphaera sp.]
MSGHGIRTVARLELKQRVRAARWPIVLGLWVVTIAAITGLTWASVNDRQFDQGPALYDVVTFCVLGLGMLVVPSLTATSINGDREHGVLATLQTTLLSAGDIVVGKLVAAWTVAMIFLATAVPFLTLAWLAGGLGIGAVALSLVVLATVLAVICAIGLMFSALTARPVASAVLTYLTVAALTVGTVIGFGLAYFLVAQEETVQVRQVRDDFWMDFERQQPKPETEEELQNWHPPEPTAADCVVTSEQRTVGHTERIWWLLPLNPFVVVADAAPRAAARADDGGAFTPMKWISDGVRTAKAGPPEVYDYCSQQVLGTGDTTTPKSGPVWPYGLGFLVLAGVGATTISRARVRTPVRSLPSGTRIA